MRGWQSGGSFTFCCHDPTRNVLNFLRGDVAERLKAAVC
jgi:hypothetical protein